VRARARLRAAPNRFSRRDKPVPPSAGAAPDFTVDDSITGKRGGSTRRGDGGARRAAAAEASRRDGALVVFQATLGYAVGSIRPTRNSHVSLLFCDRRRLS